MPTDPFASLEELLSDAITCPRLSRWEEGFLSGMRDQVACLGSRMVVTRGQAAVLKDIEEKVYACG